MNFLRDEKRKINRFCVQSLSIPVPALPSHRWHGRFYVHFSFADRILHEVRPTPALHAAFTEVDKNDERHNFDKRKSELSQRNSRNKRVF